MARVSSPADAPSYGPVVRPVAQGPLPRRRAHDGWLCQLRRPNRYRAGSAPPCAWVGSGHRELALLPTSIQAVSADLPDQPNRQAAVWRSKSVEPLEGPAPGDAAAFETWVRPHLGVMANVAARLAPDADRDDIVQDALVRAWRRRSTFSPGRGTARGWLCAVTADQARWRPRRPRRDVTTDAAPAHDSDLFLDLERALGRLPARQREAVDLVYIVGLTVAEAATAMGIAPGTVKSTLSDARDKLRPLLEVHG